MVEKDSSSDDGYRVSRKLLLDIENNTKAILRDESLNVISSTVAAMVSTLHEFGGNLPDFREFEKQIDFDGGEYHPPSHCLSFNAVVQSGEEDDMEGEEVDRYGFYITDKYRRARSKAFDEDKKELERCGKWRDMMVNWNLFSEKKKKERVRKGIPNAVRAEAWPLLLGIKPYRDKYPVELVQRMVVNLDVRLVDEVDRDVGRAFPSHRDFRREGSPGQKNLRRVLLWYAAVDPEVGFCQGMSFIAATLLVYMDVADAFHCMLAMMNLPIHGKAKMRELFLPKMVRIQQMMMVFKDLVANHMPKVSAHLETEGVQMAMFVTPWFMTLYCRDFSFDLVSRIWDSFVNGDSKIIYRVALALLTVSQKQVLKSSFEDILALLPNLPTEIDADEVWNAVWSKVKVTTAEIEALEETYH